MTVLHVSWSLVWLESIARGVVRQDILCLTEELVYHAFLDLWRPTWLTERWTYESILRRDAQYLRTIRYVGGFQAKQRYFRDLLTGYWFRNLSTDITSKKTEEHIITE